MQDPTFPSIFFNNGTSSFEFQALSESFFRPDSREVVDHLLKELNSLPMPRGCNIKLTWGLLALSTTLTLLLVPRGHLQIPCIVFCLLSIALWAKPEIVNWGYKKTLLQLVRQKKKSLSRFYAVKICRLEMNVNRLDFLIQLMPKKEPKIVQATEASSVMITN